MHIITINKQKFECFQEWEEMTLEKGCDLHKAYSSCPEKLKELYKAIVKGDKEGIEEIVSTITDEEQLKEFPVFYGKILTILTTAPQEIIDRVFAKDRTIFYDNYCLKFVLGIVYAYNIQIKRIESFKWNGETLYLPTSKMIMGVERPMAEATAIEFTEVADLQIHASKLEGGQFEVAANIISILCRPKGEKYNEDNSLKRAESMKDLPMNIVWEVFFCLMELSILLNQQEQISLLEAEMSKLQRQEIKAELIG